MQPGQLVINPRRDVEDIILSYIKLKVISGWSKRMIIHKDYNIEFLYKQYYIVFLHYINFLAGYAFIYVIHFVAEETQAM